MSVQTPAVPDYAVANMSWLRVWEVLLLQVHRFCFLLRNPGRYRLCGTEVDSKVSYSCQWSALPLEGGYHSCSRTVRKDVQSALSLLLCSAQHLYLASSAARFAPGQPVHRLSNVSGVCPVLLIAAGAITRSKP